jgi:predicted MFS family arabinose efflux permease
MVAVWSSFGARGIESRGPNVLSESVSSSPSNWIWIFCYGAFGFGYIVPATFLPAMARQVLSDSAWFGWVWPVFGAAAGLSTLLAARLVTARLARQLWAASHLVMAVGVIAPLFVPGLAGLLISALLVGGTFMVATMAGMQHARVVAGANATPLIGAMTAAFATGQVIGPLAVSALKHQPDGGLAIALSGSCVLLVLSAIVLAIARAEKPAPSP